MVSKKKRAALVLSLSCALLCLPSLVNAGIPVRVSQQAPASASTPTGAGVVGALPDLAQRGATQEYILGVGDKIKLTVFGESDISGEYEVASTGVVALPLIGDVPAANMSSSAFEKQVRDKLSDGYLNDPRVSVQVTNYRPFFILGEVSKPGSYPYVNGMTVVNAVAMAGGYTYRADKGDITMTRASDPDKANVDVPETESVMPGDIIRVPERFF